MTNEELHTKARAIAAHMPDGWDYEEPGTVAGRNYHHIAWLGSDGGASIAICRGATAASYLIIWGKLPENLPSCGPTIPTISTDYRQNAAAIAGDIERKLLPAYEQRFGAIKQEVARQAEQQKAQAGAARELAVAWDIQLTGGQTEFLVRGRNGGFHGRVGIDGDGTARLELRGLPVTLAEQILRMVKLYGV